VTVVWGADVELSEIPAWVLLRNTADFHWSEEKSGRKNWDVVSKGVTIYIALE
jgi:hypothetical protein